MDTNPTVIQGVPSANVIAVVKTKATEIIFRPAAEIEDEVVLAVKQQEPSFPLKSGTYLSYVKKAGTIPAILNFAHKTITHGCQSGITLILA